MTLDECTPQTRVRCPGNMTGKIIRVSPRLKMSVLVQRDDGAALAYRPGELTRVDSQAMQNHTRGMPPP